MGKKPNVGPSQAYREYLRQLLELHFLIADGKCDSEETDPIRDRLDELNLNYQEQIRAGELSAALYVALDTAPPVLGDDLRRAGSSCPYGFRMLLQRNGVWPGRLPAGAASQGLLDYAFAILCEKEIAALLDKTDRRHLDETVARGRGLWSLVGEAVLNSAEKGEGGAAEAAREWVTSSEGQQAMRESEERAAGTIAAFHEVQQVDPADLHKPMTI